MPTCQRCGATLEPNAVACGYCGLRTAHGEAQSQAQGLAAAERINAEKRAATESVRGKSLFALVMALAGAAVCCLPLNVVAVVLSLRAKGLARKHELIAPGTATAALIVGLFGFALSTAIWVGAGIGMYRDSQREDELERLIAERGRTPVLSHELACALVEHRLLSEGFRGDVSVSDFECAGKLTSRGEIVSLDGVRVKPSTGPVTVVACFTRGERWRLLDFSDDGRCAERAPGDAGVDTEPGTP